MELIAVENLVFQAAWAVPTGKAFKLAMVTVGDWKDGVMDEEWLMWDNQAFMKQIGLAE